MGSGLWGVIREATLVKLEGLELPLPSDFTLMFVLQPCPHCFFTVPTSQGRHIILHDPSSLAVLV